MRFVHEYFESCSKLFLSYEMKKEQLKSEIDIELNNNELFKDYMSFKYKNFEDFSKNESYLNHVLEVFSNHFYEIKENRDLFRPIFEKALRRVSSEALNNEVAFYQYRYVPLFLNVLKFVFIILKKEIDTGLDHEVFNQIISNRFEQLGKVIEISSSISNQVEDMFLVYKKDRSKLKDLINSHFKEVA